VPSKRMGVSVTKISERRWAMIDHAGSVALARSQPLTFEGDSIGHFDLMVSCGAGNDSYDVSYSERRHGERKALREALRTVTVHVGSGAAPLKVVSSRRRGTADELMTYATGTVPAALIDEVADRHGRIDVVVAAHARSSHVGLPDVDAAELDRCWAVNARSVVLLAQQLGRRHQPPPAPRPPTGRLVWFTSGQHLAPMDDEIAYAVSKGALHQMTRSVDHALRARRVTVNCVNPGPVDTGYTAGELHDRVAARFPDGRWGHPDDIAAVVAFLVGDAGAWIRGQVLDVEGGFDRFAR